MAAEAERQFNAAAQSFWVETMRVCKKLRPRGVWGYCKHEPSHITHACSTVCKLTKDETYFIIDRSNHIATPSHTASSTTHTPPSTTHIPQPHPPSTTLTEDNYPVNSWDPASISDERLDWLWDEVTALFPSIYLYKYDERATILFSVLFAKYVHTET